MPPVKETVPPVEETVPESSSVVSTESDNSVDLTCDATPDPVGNHPKCLYTTCSGIFPPATLKACLATGCTNKLHHPCQVEYEQLND